MRVKQAWEALMGSPAPTPAGLPEAEQRAAGRIVAWVDRTVLALRDGPLPATPPVRELLTLLYRLVNQEQLAILLWDATPGIAFSVVGDPEHSERRVPMILISPQFPEELQADPAFMLAGLIFCASQARDHWNERLDEINSEARALAYEAEFLRHWQRQMPGVPIPDYGIPKRALTCYPEGLASLPAPLRYVSRPAP